MWRTCSGQQRVGAGDEAGREDEMMSDDVAGGKRRKTGLMGGGWLRLALTVPLCAALFALIALSQEPGGGDKMADKPKADVQTKKSLLTFAANANAFRQVAAADPDRAVKTFGNAEFRKKWAGDAAGLFKSKAEKNILRDVFSGAVVLVGRSSADRAVGCLYSPWLDAVVLLGMEIDKSGKLSMIDYRLVAGESWRNEKGVDAAKIMSLYTTGGPLVDVLADHYHETVKVFNENYPLEGEYRIVPDSLKDRIGDTVEEATPMLARRACRLQMYRNYFSEGNFELIKSVRTLRGLLKEGDQAKLSAFLSPRQDAEMLKTICILPPDLRDGVATVYFTEDKKMAVIALVDSASPRWVFVAEVKKDAAARNIHIDALDLEMSAKLVAARKGGAK